MAGNGVSPMAEARVALQAFPSRAAADAALADRLAPLLRAAASERGEARLVVSGGTSPIGLFHALGVMPLPWRRIRVIPSDERKVPAQHPERNEAMIRRELLQGPAAAASLASLLPPDPLLLEGPGQLDAVILGMGPDGHTASLFPGSPELPRALASRNSLHELSVPHAALARISLTPHALLQTDALFLLIFGNEKREVFEMAMEDGEKTELPVRAVLHQASVPVDVFWAP